MSKNNLPRANREIDVESVRLVDKDGKMLGVVNITEAFNLAARDSLDLVEISPKAEPPVCKIMDFGRYKYEAKKKIQSSRKKQKTVTTKEIKLRPNISDHDLQIKLKSVEKFLASGDKVKISLRFKGREITHQEIGEKLIRTILEGIEETAKVELEPKFEGRQIITVISPK